MSRSRFTVLILSSALGAAGLFHPASAASAASAAAPADSSLVATAACPLRVVKLAKAKAKTLTIAGRCGVPGNASAVVLNVSARGSKAGGLWAWPGSSAKPRNPVLAWPVPRRTAGTQATVQLRNGTVRLAGRKGKTKVALDVVGYYRPSPTSQTLTVDAMGMSLTGPDVGLGTANGCATNTTANTTIGFLSLPLPVGATITAVTVAVYDGTAADSYTVALVVGSHTDIGQVASTTPLGSGGAASIRVVTTTTAMRVPVARNTVYRLQMTNLKLFNNGLCHVQVTYDLPR